MLILKTLASACQLFLAYLPRATTQAVVEKDLAELNNSNNPLALFGFSSSFDASWDGRNARLLKAATDDISKKLGYVVEQHKSQ